MILKTPIETFLRIARYILYIVLKIVLACLAAQALAFPSFIESIVWFSFFRAFRLELRPEQYLRAVSDYGFDGSCYKLSIGPSGAAGSKSGSILGAVLMEGFYVVFDKSGKRIGWAENNCKTIGSKWVAYIH